MAQVYAFQNTDEQVMRSSSGGAFIALCQAFELEHGAGNVAFYGAAFDEDFNVKHMGVFSAGECGIFQGSKYVKSECNIVFPDVKAQIENGKSVLFSGTPCQIFALNSFIKKNDLPQERLLTIDVICHGTPGKDYWTDYKKWLEHKFGGKLVKYSFRYKPEGWKAYPAYAEFDNGKKAINTAETSVFPAMYIARYSITEGCFSCPFSKEDRVSDITLGDYWGVEKVFRDIPYKTGVSLVLAHTVKAMQLVEKLNQGRRFFRKTEDKSYLDHQHNLNRPTEKPERYEKFREDYRKTGFEETLKKYLGYGFKYRFCYNIKKIVRKTPLIEWYRYRKEC